MRRSTRSDWPKTRRDILEFARTKRLAFEEANHNRRMSAKVCGHPRLNRQAERELDRLLYTGGTDDMHAKNPRHVTRPEQVNDTSE